jgi:hypothetical protein
MAHDTGGAGGLLDPFDITGQKGAKEAEDKNEETVARAMKALNLGFGDSIATKQGILEDIEGMGEVSRMQAKDLFTQRSGGYRQSALGKTLSSSTVAENFQRGAERDYMADLASINEGLAALRSNINLSIAGSQEGLGLAKSSFLGGVQYNAPPGVLEQMGGAQGIASLAALSDERLKRDIRRIGRVGRHNVYSWRWRGTGEIGVGVIAQEVERYQPDAVLTTAVGFKAVYYGRL